MNCWLSNQVGIERASLGKPIVPIVKETRLLDMEWRGRRLFEAVRTVIALSLNTNCNRKLIEKQTDLCVVALKVHLASQVFFIETFLFHLSNGYNQRFSFLKGGVWEHLFNSFASRRQQFKHLQYLFIIRCRQNELTKFTLQSSLFQAFR